ncbi:PA14 domain-containing protein [Flavisolibacter ginsenosidimutans]|uniref:Beta-glucosidase n=1 Tax=Flavisolibacter ginsenosidimutans TaxID=661481 RepID=A0A5B8UK91_9BACT|nr:PA14 domain-containing protein [Flavisolibacter ginsenosidimutans]QEC56435.1 beta-glucosidase [Flavisolibacter ginsenosidimutans]
MKKNQLFYSLVFFLVSCTCNRETKSNPAATGNEHAKDSLAFGDTHQVSDGLEGKIYYLPVNTPKLPASFDTMKAVATIYTKTVNVPQRSWSTGFPGAGNRFEWFAIEYNGKFKPGKAGRYTFTLLSDDGSRLFIDDSLVINNDGLHGPAAKSGSLDLSASYHDMRLQYFQGPRYFVALQLFAHLDKEKDGLFPGTDFSLSTPGESTGPNWIVIGVVALLLLLLLFLLWRREKTKEKKS